MPDHWLCIAHLTPPAFTDCRAHGEGDKDAEKHTRQTGHPTMTGLEPGWLQRLHDRTEKTVREGGLSVSREEAT